MKLPAVRPKAVALMLTDPPEEHEPSHLLAI
jgi:hypothetical protein